jgi:hypothetical protein
MFMTKIAVYRKLVVSLCPMTTHAITVDDQAQAVNASGEPPL